MDSFLRIKQRLEDKQIKSTSWELKAIRIESIEHWIIEGSHVQTPAEDKELCRWYWQQSFELVHELISLIIEKQIRINY